MKPSDWPRIEDLFHRAAMLARAERKAFLDRECPDAELRAEVELLLTHDDSQGVPIDDVVREAAHELARESSEWLVGRRIGVYQVTGLVGEGGMGAVYKAVRDDDHFRKEVALKIVRRGAETQALLRRFRAERQILAQLDHPYIARLLDGGATEDGLPFLVMELIDGVPITHYARDHNLSVEARLRLFQKVCEAVQYAHSKLVVHRDLKPANILITREGTPRLLDFGIAKLLIESGEVTDATGTLRLLTPFYASPEQVRGAHVGTATDVYSLGTILYELLTGRRPFGSEGQSPVEITAAVITQEPLLPSRAEEVDAATRKRLSGDLDNIVLMAMRKEPERRYQSVEQFSLDIGRYLNAEPVAARPATLLYRSGKFFRRNRLAVTAATLAVLSLLVGASVAVMEARRAERRFQQVRKLANTFLFTFHDQIQNLAGSTAAREFVVKTALEYLDSLAAESGNDVGLQEELANAYLRVATVQGDPRSPNLGQSEAAMVSLNKSISIAEAILNRQPAHRGVLLVLTKAYGIRGDLLLLTQRPQSVVAMRRSVELAARLCRLPNATASDWTERAFGLMRLSDVLTADSPKEAMAVLEQARDSAQQVVKQSPSEESRRSLAQVYQRMGRVSHELGDPERALEYLAQSRTLIEKLRSEFPDNVRYTRELTVLLILTAGYTGSDLYFNLGRPEEARRYLEQASVLQKMLASKDPKDKRARMEQAMAAYRLVGTYFRRPEPQAVELGRRCLAILDELIAESPKDHALVRVRRNCVTAFARLMANMGKGLEFVDVLEKTLQEAEQAAAAGPDDVVQQALLSGALDDLSYVHLKARQWDKAERYLRRNIALEQMVHKKVPDDLYFTRYLADSQEGMGELEQGRGDAGKAAEWYRQSIATWDEWAKAARSRTFASIRKAAVEERLRSLGARPTIQ